MRWLILFIFVAHAAISFGQESDQQLATYYYNAGDFEKASMYYSKLFEKDPSKINFNRYFECLTQTNQLKEAERVLKKQLNANKFDLEYTVLYAQFLEENKEPEKAQKIYKEMIDDIRADANSVISVFNALRSKGKNDLALQAIEKGRKLLKGSDPLHFQFAELYGALGETDKMIAEYLDVLDYSMGYLQTAPELTDKDRERLEGYFKGTGKAVLTEPHALLTEASKLPGLDGAKMSKSYHNTIAMREDAASIESKVKRMPTDPARVKRTDAGHPDRCPVWQFHLVYSPVATREWVKTECTRAGIGCLECKQPIIDAILAEQQPMLERAEPFVSNPRLVRDIVDAGTQRARATAQETMRDVREAMGLNY
jgi:tryptophanyl-tRNA synthetase